MGDSTHATHIVPGVQWCPLAYKTCLVRSKVLITLHVFNFNEHHRTSKDARDVMDAM